MKKNHIIALFALVLVCACVKTIAIPNPWIDCEDDISCAAKKAGFNLPLAVENYSARAMKGMLELNFALDKKRNVILRKTVSCEAGEDKNGICDISGVYENYPVNKTIMIEKAVPFNVKGKKNTFYVANFAAETGYYSMYCPKGMKLKDLKRLYKLLRDAEAPRGDYSSIEQLQESRRVDDIVEPVYTQDCFPRTLEKKGVEIACFERANLGDDSACSLSEIKMIKEYYKKGQDKDPLNDGNGNFCGETDNTFQ